MAVLLLAASAIYVSLGDVPDAIVTLAALVPITAVSLLLEVRAERALAGGFVRPSERGPSGPDGRPRQSALWVRR
jgi:hypothetical protein